VGWDLKTEEKYSEKQATDSDTFLEDLSR